MRETELKIMFPTEKLYSFNHIGTSDTLYVFESSIDMLSYISLHQSNWQQHSCVTHQSTALLLVFYVIRTKAMGREVDKEMVKSLSGLLTLFLLIEVGMEFFEFFVGAYGLEDTELATIETIFRSPFSWSFWSQGFA